MFLPRAGRIELTEILADYDGDTVMDDPRSRGDWSEIAREHHPAEDGRPAFDFVSLERA